MRIFKERRSPRAYKLRVYIDAIKQAKATTDEEWMNIWAKNCTVDSIYIPRYTWISMLEQWALREAEALSLNPAA